jgi:hypothetical protein
LKKILLILTIIALQISAFANEQAGQEIAFLQSGLGARPEALGGAFTSIANDSNAVFWNPAGMVYAKSLEIGSMHTKLATDLDVYYLSSVFQNKHNVDKKAENAWGLYWVNASMNDIPLVTQNEGVTVNTDVKPDDYTAYQAHAIGLAYADFIQENISYGINVTGFYKDFDKINQGRGAGISITPGLMWMIDSRVVLGIVIRDLINYQYWATGGTEYVIPELRAGLSSEIISNLLIAGEIRRKLSSKYATRTNIGVEYLFANFIKFRIGFNQNKYTSGCGIYSKNLNVDYAYTGEVDDGLGANHKVSIGVRY